VFAVRNVCSCAAQKAHGTAPSSPSMPATRHFTHPPCQRITCAVPVARQQAHAAALAPPNMPANVTSHALCCCRMLCHYITLHYITLHYITLHYMLHSREEWQPHSGANERLTGGQRGPFQFAGCAAAGVCRCTRSSSHASNRHLKKLHVLSLHGKQLSACCAAGGA
jgi:hypothetical protein